MMLSTMFFGFGGRLYAKHAGGEWEIFSVPGGHWHPLPADYVPAGVKAMDGPQPISKSEDRRKAK